MPPIRQTQRQTKQQDSIPKRFHEIKVYCNRLKQKHCNISHQTIGDDVFPFNIRSVTTPQHMHLPNITKKETLYREAEIIDSDTIFKDTTGYPFIFYLRESLSETEHSTMAARVRTQTASHKNKSWTETRGSTSRHSVKEKSVIPHIFEFTSVPLGHGSRGIMLSKDFTSRINNEQFEQIARLAEFTTPAIRVASAMYYIMAEMDSSDTHNVLMDLASQQYESCNIVTRALLGAPYSPFSHRRLICNLNSDPHVDAGNERYALNALTFFGKADLWLVVLLHNRAYKFRATPGATLLLPAGLLIHYTMGWTSNERFVTTSWTSNQLGYKKLIELEKED